MEPPASISIAPLTSNIGLTPGLLTPRHNPTSSGHFKAPATIGARTKFLNSRAIFRGPMQLVPCWTEACAEPIGTFETLPLSLSLPVKVQADGRVNAALEVPTSTTLK